jgi:hypothetical protein
VFQDLAWAERGIQALQRHAFPSESLTILALDTAEASALIQRVTGGDPSTIEVRGLGRVAVRGPLEDALQGGDRDLDRIGLVRAMKRVGFQEHDGAIFETLVSRGGVLVAIRNEPRAADALAVLHNYGGGNAAIGAWTGRV